MKYLLSALLLLLTFSPALADTIAGMRDTSRDYVLEGTVQTVWEDSFLLNDGTGTVIVDVRPYSTYKLGLSGQNYVMVTGRPQGNILKPLVISRHGNDPVMFSGTAMLPDLSMQEVMQNTAKHRLPEPVVAAPRTKKAPDAKDIASATASAVSTEVDKAAQAGMQSATLAKQTVNDALEAAQSGDIAGAKSALANSPGYDTAAAMAATIPEVAMPTIGDFKSFGSR